MLTDKFKKKTQKTKLRQSLVFLHDQSIKFRDNIRESDTGLELLLHKKRRQIIVFLNTTNSAPGMNASCFHSLYSV